MARAATISLKDDFEYPMPKRETNWTLPNAEHKRSFSTSSASDPTGAARKTNNVSDIDGAQPCTTVNFRVKRFEHKPNLFNVGDIEGSSPTRHIPERVNKDNTRNLRNGDIEHSYPESKLFSTPRVVNPLEPVYPLPQVKHRMPTPPTQLHETLKTSDIPGTHARPSKLRSTSDRNPLDYSDVSVPAQRKRQTESMALQTRDITHGDRDTGARLRKNPYNPLEPVYTVSGPNATAETIGEVLGSKPRGLPPARRDLPDLSLMSRDIDGASPAARYYKAKARHGAPAVAGASYDILTGK